RRKRGWKYQSAGRTPAMRTASATRSSGTPSNGPLIRSGQSSAAAAKTPQSEYTVGHCTCAAAMAVRATASGDPMQTAFSSLDAAIVVVYLAVLIAVGVYFSRRQRSLEE